MVYALSIPLGGICPPYTPGRCTPGCTSRLSVSAVYTRLVYVPSQVCLSALLSLFPTSSRVFLEDILFPEVEVSGHPEEGLLCCALNLSGPGRNRVKTGLNLFPNKLPPYYRVIASFASRVGFTPVSGRVSRVRNDERRPPRPCPASSKPCFSLFLEV